MNLNFENLCISIKSNKHKILRSVLNRYQQKNDINAGIYLYNNTTSRTFSKPKENHYILPNNFVGFFHQTITIIYNNIRHSCSTFQTDSESFIEKVPTDDGLIDAHFLLHHFRFITIGILINGHLLYIYIYQMMLIVFPILYLCNPSYFCDIIEFRRKIAAFLWLF